MIFFNHDFFQPRSCANMMDLSCVALGTVLSLTVALMYGDGCIMYIWCVAVVLSDAW